MTSEGMNSEDMTREDMNSEDMTSQGTGRRVYRVAADPAQVDAAGPPPRPPDRRLTRVVWDLPDDALPALPALRAWMREHGVTGVEEYGLVVHEEPLPPRGEPYGVAGLPSQRWEGPPLTRAEPCPRCGLPVTRLVPGVGGDAAAPYPLAYLSGPGAYLAAPGLVDELRAAGLDGGLAAPPLGDGVLLVAEHALGGPAYPFGPRPCEVCGRASESGPRGPVFARPRYAYRLTFDRPDAHWSWSTVYGQAMPLVSGAVAGRLAELVPGVRFLPHGRPDDPGAFLPERYREEG
ncbi:hypothetical protein [Phytohabitans suffuscus]|uniref:Uncharacterized protein n=1 Tax=Phytohabitans suffuscus TaxID=624315 RepID=A0A6F8YY82_9ACTN|nr:hypothetical protein [Phytohabitans suffuscus]BCB91039.1 hypothetical protein Psuf_083520 [Phytohabitans suffuscus]